MAEYRQIHTHIWRDDWFLELSPTEKLLFVYLFSNESTNLAGIYKLSTKHVELETGLSMIEVTETMSKFEDAGKIVHLDGYVWVRNLRKYNASPSPKTARAIEIVLEAIPHNLQIKRLYMEYYQPGIPYRYPIDTPPTKQNSTVQNSTEQQTQTGFEILAGAFETLTGYPIIPSEENINTLNAWVADGMTPTDIQDSVAYYSGNGRTARTPRQIDKSVRTAYAKRVQAGYKPVPIDPASLASEVFG